MNTATDIQVYDTTLRDGAQMEGITLSVSDKLRIAQALDAAGVAIIEGGWPGAIPKDTEFFTRARMGLVLKNARLAAFGATCKAQTSAEKDPQVAALLDSGAPIITLVAKSDVRHVEQALKTDKEENLRMVRDTVTYLSSQAREVMVDAEHYFDGLDYDPQYGIQVLIEAGKAGASTLILCDTNGGSLPGKISEITKRTRAALDNAGLKHVKLGIHTHNDTGCAVANALAAVEAGAVQIQGCVNGYGERTGNADLLTLVSNLELKTGRRALQVEGALRELTHLSVLIAEIVNLPPARNLPYVGLGAFAHKAGLHASAIRVNADLYQHIDPKIVGNDMRMLVSEMAGRASVELKAKEMGVDLTGTPYLTARVVDAIKEREAAGYTYDAADASFELLVRSCGGDLPSYFQVESWRAMVSSRMQTPAAKGKGNETEAEATVKVRTFLGRTVSTGEGNGPVNALDHALRQGLAQAYPQVDEFELVDYKVRILDTSHGTDAGVRVLITTTNGTRTWTTVGVGTDVIEASWEALGDSITWGLLKEGVRPE